MGARSRLRRLVVSDRWFFVTLTVSNRDMVKSRRGIRRLTDTSMLFVGDR